MAHRPITVSRRPLTESETVSVRRPLAPSVKDNLPASNATAAKSHLKLEDKLTKAELKIQDLERDRAAVHNEIGDLQTELRLAAQREAKLKHNIEKWEKSHSSLKEKTSKLSNLQGRLEELHKVHEDSKARRQKEIDELNDKLKRAEERRKHEVAEARKASEAERTRAEELESKSKAVELRIQSLQSKADGSAEETGRIIERLQAEKESIKVALMDAQMYTKQTESKMQQKIDTLQHALEKQRHSLDDEAQKQAQQTESARAQLLAQVQELTQDIEQLESVHERNLAAIAKATYLHVDHIQAQSANKQSVSQHELHHAVMGRLQADMLASQRLDELQQLTEIIEHAEHDRDAAHQLVSILQQDLDSVLAELLAERALVDAITEQNLGEDDLSSRLESSDSTELDSLRAALQDAQSRSEALDNELQELHNRYLEKVSEAKGSNVELQAAKKQVATLESTLATKAAEVERLTNQLVEMEVLRGKLRTAQDETTTAVREARSQGEAVKSVSASLQNARVAEQAWREERDRLAIMLDEASKYEDLYNELSSQTRHLIERNALAEQEKATLSALNSELLGHTNPNQKIMYMDRVRRELDEVKEDNISLRIQLQQMTAAKVDMEKELRSYKAVDVPLSMRPRTELTRVVRAADHDALLRSVSSTLDKPAEPIVAYSAPVAVLEPIEPIPVEAEVVVSASKPLKKRRSYGSISVHTAEAPAPLDAGPISDDETAQDETIEAVPKPVVANRNRPRATLVNSGSLRQTSNASVNDQTATMALPTVVERSVIAEEQDEDITQVAPVAPAPVVAKPTSRPSLGASSLGIKARRVSELVRASSPPLPMISDVSSDVPNLMNSALPSPSPHMMSDWTMDTPGSAPMPLLRGEFGVGPSSYGLTHSTPLARQSPRKTVTSLGGEDSRPRTMRRSRYSGAQRVAVPVGGLRPVNARTSLVIREENGEESTIYEDQDDSLRQGWHDDGAHNLPEFTIDGLTSTTVTQRPEKALPRKSKSSKARPSASKLVKPGPMARSIFR